MPRRAVPPCWWSRLPDPDGCTARHPVELKILVSDDSTRAVHAAAGTALPERALHWFDTPGLDLSRLGVVLRLRTIGGNRCDVTLKIRRDDPVRVPASLRHHRELAVEIDTLPDARHWSAALRHELPPSVARKVLAGRRALDGTLTSAQRRLYRAHAPDGPDLAHLDRVGPVRIRRARLATLDCGSRVVIEACRYPDGTRLTEVSAKCPAHRAARAAAEFTELLRDLHVDTAADQHTKTRTALEILAS